MYTSIISSKIEITIIEFFYFREKYGGTVFFASIFKGENNIFLYFPL